MGRDGEGRKRTKWNGKRYDEKREAKGKPVRKTNVEGIANGKSGIREQRQRNRQGKGDGRENQTKRRHPENS